MSKVAMYSTSELFGKRVTGGLKRFLELYYGMKNDGINVDLFSADSNKVLIENGIEGISLDKNIKKNSLFIPAELKILLQNRKIIKFIKRQEYKSVIVFDVPTAIGLCICGVKNINMLIRQDLIGYKKISFNNRIRSKLLCCIYLKFMKLCESICIIRSKKIIVQCKYDLNELVKRHSFLKKSILRKTKIQINNVNPSWIVSKSQISNKNDELKFQKEFKIGFIGDFSNERKGHKIFIEAIKSILDDGFNIKVTIIGDGKQLNYYKNICDRYTSIEFTGRIENPLKLIKMCDLIVVPSLLDSCPNTVMESLYNEVLVIGSNSGGIPEILVDKEFLFETNSISIKNKILDIIINNKLENLLKKQKIRKKELEFDWCREIIKLLDFN